jgi:hypothetical protein
VVRDRQDFGSRTHLVVRIAHSRRPLALASPPRAFARTRVVISRSLADLVLFLIIKPVREPGNEATCSGVFLPLSISGGTIRRKSCYDPICSPSLVVWDRAAPVMQSISWTASCGRRIFPGTRRRNPSLLLGL